MGFQKFFRIQFEPVYGKTLNFILESHETIIQKFQILKQKRNGTTKA